MVGRFRISVTVTSAAAILSALSMPLPAQPRRGGAAGGECAYFADANYQGMRGVQRAGENPWVGHGWNDRISSVQCDPGCVLDAYEHIDFGGARERFRGNVGFVGPAWNDRASSLRVSCGGRDWARDDARGHGDLADGYYRRAGDPRVWQLREDRACRVTDPGQMGRFGGFGQVREVSPQTDLLRSRRDTGLCVG